MAEENGGTPEGTKEGEGESLLTGGATPGEGEGEGEKTPEPEFQLDDDGKQILDDDGNPVPVEPKGYEDFSLPEGTEVDEGLLADFSTMALEKGLSQEQAQEVVSMFAGYQSSVMDAHMDMVSDWQNKSKNDSEYGGESFDASIGVAEKALDQFADDDFRKLMVDTGVGNHPAMIRFAWKVGQQLAEDNPGAGGKAGGEEMTTEEIMYGQP